MSSSQFVYVTYIRAKPQTVWEALIKPEFTKQYWFGFHQESAWKAGSEWKLLAADGKVTDTGEVVEIDPPRRLVLKWRNEFRPEMKAEGYSRCVMELEADGETTKLTVTHTIEQDHSKIIEAVSGGWPKVLSSLKSLLETGHGLPRTHDSKKG